MNKHYVSPDDLRKDSFKLGAQVYDSGFQPDFMIALWRGGAPIGCHVHECLEYMNKREIDHIAIRTSRYTKTGQPLAEVKVHNLRYLLENIDRTTKLLIVDDIADSGHTVDAVIKAIDEGCGEYSRPCMIKIATLYYKPTKYQSLRKPDYFVHTTDKWVVFPHELEGMTREEIIATMGLEIANIVTKPL